jgi:serine phosphatase RsbU (regulator of sigma subunit)
MRAFLCIALYFIFCLTYTFSQNSKVIDSLNTAIANSPDDTNKVNLLIKLSGQYDYLSSKEKVMYLNDAYLLASKYGFKTKIEYTLSYLSKIYFYREFYDLSYVYATKYIDFLEKENMHDKALSAQNLLGSIYSKQGKFNDAKRCFFKAVSYYKAVEDYQKLAIVFNNISILFSDSNKFDSALHYAVSGYKILLQYNTDSSAIANALNNIATIEFSRNNYTSAIEMSNSALSIYTKIGNELGIALSNNSLGDIYFKMQNYNQALVHFKLCLDYVKENHWLTHTRDCYLAIANVYAKKGEFKDAFKNLEMHNLFRDSIASFEITAKFLEMEVKYELSKNEKHLAEKEKEVVEKEFELTKKNTQRNILMISLIAITLLLSLSIYAFMQKKKDNNLIKNQKEIVEIKHKEITDSINYAERIQRSFLATTEMLDISLKDYFVFFRPKDVVSGDFYWAGELNNGNFAFSCADSTGHGVPGAIMSILNISSLEKSIERETEPHKILNQTRRIIIDRLKKDGSKEGGKDGMDCSLFVINKDKTQLSFSMANNPVFIVRLTVIASEERTKQSASSEEIASLPTVARNDDNEGVARNDDYQLFEYKPDKMPVGKHEKENEPFTLHTLQLQKGDIIYALTDGFQDQFGGSKGKKFKIKNLKELLLQIAHLPMHEQEQKLAEEFATWKGSNEQVDDVCLIGVRI